MSRLTTRIIRLERSVPAGLEGGDLLALVGQRRPSERVRRAEERASERRSRRGVRCEHLPHQRDSVVDGEIVDDDL